MATNYASATYQEIIDVQTTPGQISIMGIHTPQGTSPYARLKGFFTQFRKYRYNGISNFLMVPAAQLPVDPLGITGITGSTDTMDPRDMLNPILFHGCHGESLTAVLNRIYSQTNQNDAASTASVDPISTASENTAPSLDEFELDVATDFAQYYNKLTDKTWKKFGIQSGVKLRGLHPLVHKLAMNMPILPHYGSAYDTNAGLLQTNQGSAPTNLEAPTSVAASIDSRLNVPIDIDSRDYRTADGGISAYKQMMTNGMQRLDWLPTSYAGVGTDPVTGGSSANTLTLLPKLFMGLLILPPAYNVEQFFRVIITHSFSFKGFTTSLNLMDPIANVPTGKGPLDDPYYNWIEYSDTIDSIGAKAQTVSDGVM